MALTGELILYLFKTKILKNSSLTRDIVNLRIAAPEDFCRKAAPGRFIMLGNDNNLSDPLLKRPFGICNWGKNWFEVVIKMVGKGSRQLGLLQEGALLSVHGPLGEGYPVKNSAPVRNHDESVIMVAGGMGIASIASCLLPTAVNDEIKREKVLLYGAAKAEELVLLDKIKECRPNLRIETITDDGSSGRKGFVTELLKTELQVAGNVTFACGPEPMLKSVQQVLQEFNSKGFLSLENRMACGFGVCLGCVQTIVGDAGSGDVKSAKVCTQGPVFPAEEVIF
ncbi:MAG: hypothetical protein DRH03_03800 [Deltaproteobacteria bacterium]|nr:MAG: hypothetical protein DRH03_03800 [Deltaproteobacteria bacterium]